MKKKKELKFLRLLFILGIVSFVPLIRKKPSKHMNEWLIVFFMKSYISSILDTIINKKGYISYPVNLFKIFNISVLFSYILFPLTCVYYNQITRKSGLIGIALKSVCFSLPMTLAENWLERHTNLVRYRKGWNRTTTFVSITATFLFVRGLIAIVRAANKLSQPSDLDG